MTDDKTTKRIDRRNAELSQIADALERWHKKLSRAVAAIDKLRARRKNILKPRKLTREEGAKSKLTSAEWHKIRDQDFSDDIPDFLSA